MDGVAVYEEDFENEFLATTRAFYRAESQVKLSMQYDRCFFLPCTAVFYFAFFGDRLVCVRLLA